MIAILAVALTVLTALAAGPGPTLRAGTPPAGTPPPRRVPLALPGAPPTPQAARALRPPEPQRPATLRELLASTPADSLAGPLRRFESDHSRTLPGAEAAFALGQFHYARGEYRQAGDAFARAAARFPPMRKAEARYWQGLSSLGAGDAVQARAALEELARGAGVRQAEAQFALAHAWEKAGRPDRAEEELRMLLAGVPGEMTAPALERLAELSRILGKADAAKRAEEQLRRSHPGSIEAMRRSPPATAPPEAEAGRSERGRIAVQIGAFGDPARARELLQRARQAGFAQASTHRQGQGGTELHVVRIGWFPTEADARRAGERASAELGVAFRIIRDR